jgi:hypothetical protein
MSETTFLDRFRATLEREWRAERAELVAKAAVLKLQRAENQAVGVWVEDTGLEFVEQAIAELDLRFARRDAELVAADREVPRVRQRIRVAAELRTPHYAALIASLAGEVLGDE